MRLVFGIVGVAARIKGVEGASVVGIERKPQLDTLGQVWVRDEMTTERYQAGLAIGHRGLRRIGFKPTRVDDRSVEDFAQLLRGNRTLPFGDQFATLDPRFDDVEIGQLEVVESLGDVV